MIGLLLLLLFANPALGKPVAVTQGNGIKVTLTDDKCAFTHVINLPYRATWEQDGRTFEGCFGIHAGIVVAYFSDKSIALLPGQAFVPVRES
jgi:hypothetical protein